jgi:hypothetical protein
MMRTTRSPRAACATAGAALLLALAASAGAEQATATTIPELLKAAGKSLRHVTGVPSGQPPTVDQLLRNADVVVRAVIGPARSHLTDDQREIQTDYSVSNPVILFSATRLASSNLLVVLQGGSVTINGLTFTSESEALPALKEGAEYLLILRHVGDAYEVSGPYLGAFEIERGTVRVATRKQGFGREFDGAHAAALESKVAEISQARSAQ